MSLSLTINKAVESAIQTYIARISKQYNINENELKSIWSGNSELTTEPKAKPENKEKSELDNLNKQELIKLCKDKGLKSTGTKADMIQRLTNGETAPVKKQQTRPEIASAPTVIQKITATIPNVSIRRNQFGNFEHSDTSLVFNNKTKKVIGKQNNSGTVDNLTPEDIETCKQHKFQYELPENLDNKTSLTSVAVEELDDASGDDVLLEDDEEEFLEEDEEEDEEEYVDDE